MAYSKKTWASNELVTATGLNLVSDNIEFHVRSLVSGRKIAFGVKEITWPGNHSPGTGIVTFATDANDGDPGFTNAPFVIAGRIDIATTSLPIGTRLEIIVRGDGDITNTYAYIDSYAFDAASGLPQNGDKSSFWWVAIGD